MTLLLLWIAYLGTATVILLVIRWLRRSLRAPFAVILLSLPLVFCLPGFLRGRTILPTDQVSHFAPWSASSSTPARNPYLNDIATQLAPWAKAVRMAWKEGSLPLRNLWNGCGSPLAANGQSAAFSPFTFAMGVLPLAHGFTLTAAVKLILALTGTWLWLSELGLRAPSALVGAIAFAFSLTMTPLLLFPLSGVLCLWPWALFAIEAVWSGDRTPREFGLLVAIFSTWILAGHPESACLGVCAIGLFLVGRLLARDSPIRLRRLPTVLSAGVLAAALTAFLWVPQSLAVRDSNRFAWASEVANSWRGHGPHLPGWSLGFVTTVFPTAFGDDLAAPQLSIAPFRPPEMMLAYFGAVGWALGLLILRPGSARQRPEIALLLPMLCGLAVATGAWPVFEGFLSIPLLRLISPPRFFSWVALFGSALAAFELDRFSRDAGESRGRAALALAAPVLLGGAILTAFFRLRPLHEASGGLVSVRAGVVRTLVTLAVVTLLLLWVCRSPKRTGAAGTLLAAMAFGELALQGSRLYRWGDPREWFPRVPMVEFLASQAHPFRVVGEQAAVFPATNIFAGVEEIRTHDAIERRDYVEFLDRTCGYDPNPYFKQLRNLESPALDFLNVRFLVSGDPARAESQRWRRVYTGPDGSVLENTRVLPRVFAPDRLRIVSASPVADAPLPEDWSREATLVANRENLSESNAPAEVREYRETANQVRFRARPLDPGHQTVLVTSLVDDGGWSATGDRGAPLQTFRANAVFLAVLLPSGPQAVRLDYRPPGFRAGLAVSAAAALLVLVVLVRNASKRRTSPVRSSDNGMNR